MKTKTKKAKHLTSHDTVIDLVTGKPRKLFALGGGTKDGRVYTKAVFADGGPEQVWWDTEDVQVVVAERGSTLTPARFVAALVATYHVGDPGVAADEKKMTQEILGNVLIALSEAALSADVTEVDDRNEKARLAREAHWFDTAAAALSKALMPVGAS